MLFARYSVRRDEYQRKAKPRGLSPSGALRFVAVLSRVPRACTWRVRYIRWRPALSMIESEAGGHLLPRGLFYPFAHRIRGMARSRTVDPPKAALSNPPTRTSVISAPHPPPRGPLHPSPPPPLPQPPP